jgi:hypothetical protein
MDVIETKNEKHKFSETKWSTLVSIFFKKGLHSRLYKDTTFNEPSNVPAVRTMYRNI